ncbi:hypothetical protein [Paraclostridium bifermentans]|uniref:hypothetical protein n=1 Tax=Paraclostridium bifermentans TaxID=1490 RepID=UPI0018AB6590|nr:hypothetical protein [Paraclostridium bifermentans]
MLIEIDISLKEYIEKNISKLNESSEEIEVIENIARSYSEKRHIIIAKRSILLYFSKLDLLEKKVRSIYTDLYSRSAQYKVYKSVFVEYIKILSNEYSFRKVKENSQCIYEVPINYFNDNRFLRESVLVTENLRDAWLYKSMTKKYIKQVMQINLDINLEEMNGGGNDLSIAYENKIKENRLVVCVADSDKRYPNSTIGDTARYATNIYKNYDSYRITYMHKLGVREKENLIPPSFYLLCTNGINIESLKNLVELEVLNNSSSEFLKYIDIKDGIELKSYRGDNKNYINYIKHIIEEHPELIACDLESEKDLQVKVILGAGKKAIDTFHREILDDNLDNILEYKLKVLKEDNNESLQTEIDDLKNRILKKENLFIHLPKYIEEEWVKLCNIVLAWGCVDEFRAIS